MWIWHGIIDPFGQNHTERERESERERCSRALPFTFRHFCHIYKWYTQTNAHARTPTPNHLNKPRIKSKIYSCYGAIIVEQTNKISIRLALNGVSCVFLTIFPFVTFKFFRIFVAVVVIWLNRTRSHNHKNFSYYFRLWRVFFQELFVVVVVALFIRSCGLIHFALMPITFYPLLF